jgi:uncharacterized protein (DUF427 family)
VPSRPTPEPIAPGQESVWDYPRPPVVRASDEQIVVVLGGVEICETSTSWRVLETSHPPVYYLPADDVRTDLLEPTSRRTFCEFKGGAAYADLVVEGVRVRDAAWHYPRPASGFAPIAGAYAFYAGRVDRCLVDGEEVVAQPGDFYGGWITSEVVGPFKGGAGTSGW